MLSMKGLTFNKLENLWWPNHHPFSDGLRTPVSPRNLSVVDSDMPSGFTVLWMSWCWLYSLWILTTAKRITGVSVMIIAAETIVCYCWLAHWNDVMKYSRLEIEWTVLNLVSLLNCSSSAGVGERDLSLFTISRVYKAYKHLRNGFSSHAAMMCRIFVHWQHLLYFFLSTINLFFLLNT